MSDSERVLRILKEHPNEWVGELYARTNCMVHSRIADLRRSGHVIQSKCFGRDDCGRSDYRYRLVVPNSAGQLPLIGPQ